MKTKILLLYCIVLLLSGCATTEVIDTWKDDAPTQKLTNIYVLGALKEPVYRRLIENEMVKVLKDAGVNSRGTFAQFPDVANIDKAAADAFIKERNIDGIMVIRPVDTRQETVYTPGQTYVPGGYYGRYAGGWHGYYGGAYQMMSTPGYTTEYLISTVESTIYRTDGKQPIWSTVTETSETSVKDAIESYIKVLRSQIKASGLF